MRRNLFNLLDLGCSIVALGTVYIMKFIAGIVRAAKNDKTDSKQKILIIACDVLGDNMMRMPFFLALRNRFPRERYHIAIMLTKSVGAFLRPKGIFDEIIEDGLLNERHPFFWLFERKRFVCGVIRWALHNKAYALIWMLRMRSLGCDFVHLLTRPEVSVAYTSDAAASIFPATALLQGKFFDRKYTHLLEPKMGVHLLEDLNVMYHWVADTNARLDTDGTAIYMRNTLGKIVSSDIKEKDHYKVLVPGAGRKMRQWPASRFAALAVRLGGEFVVVGTKSEKELGEKIAELVGDKVKITNLCGRTSLDELGSVLMQADVVITNETGTATYAAVIGAPTVCILGGGDFGAFFPNKNFPWTRSVYHAEDCFLCRWKCSRGKNRNAALAPCIEGITVDDVYSAIGDLMPANPV